MSKQRDDDSGQGGYASPPCFLHELDPAYLGLAPEPDRRRHQTERTAAALDDTPNDVSAES